MTRAMEIGGETRAEQNAGAIAMGGRIAAPTVPGRTEPLISHAFPFAEAARPFAEAAAPQVTRGVVEGER